MNGFLDMINTYLVQFAVAGPVALYLIPFAIAIPVALLVFFVGTRRSDDLPPGQIVLTPHTPAPAAPAPPPPKAAVLVVDDSAVARAKLKRLFESQGYQVETANDGHDALEKIGARHFAVVVTDLEMPTMDGFELIAAVQGNMETEDLPIIAITGHDELQARVHDCQGLYGIFKKPWNDRELLKRVETLSTLRAGVKAAQAAA